MILSELQIAEIRSHMLQQEEALKIQYKARKDNFVRKKVLHNEVEDWAAKGFMEQSSSSRKTTMIKQKEHGIQFEDDIWCMFYNLGFRILNNDEHLVIQWGPNKEDSQQLDVVAVSDDAIFVVECKAAYSLTKGNFKTELNKIEQYKGGVSSALKQIYGNNKRVKFIFATRNYRIGDEDKMRMLNSGIYNLNNNAYDYITNLIKNYKESVVYQFYALMFKDELINDKEYKIPVLRGTMGGNKYYIFSIEPSILLKIGFILHRTRVNDSMAPTYQRLLIPKRLKGITKFIDDGGYFPNSIIINFNSSEKVNIRFRKITAETDSKSEFGFLYIPNAYAFAFIIDGQHRLYGYAQSKHKDLSTIPVVAFENMPSEEQLQIFMDINENQKAVSPSLRLDLVQDLYWESGSLDSRMKALRSAIIKNLASDMNKVLYNKITIGEDISSLSLKPFDAALSKSGLIPKATKTQWNGDTDICIFNTNETDLDKAMHDAKDRITTFINDAYEIADEVMDDECKSKFLFSNRATYAFICLIGSLHGYLVKIGKLNHNSSVSERSVALRPYIEYLSKALNDLPSEINAKLSGYMGQGADTFWLRSYQNIINKFDHDYCPEELIEWKETQDKSIQDSGKKFREDIKKQLRYLLFSLLEKVYGPRWESNVAILKHEVEGRILKEFQETDGFDMADFDWRDYLEISDYKDVISKNFSSPEFEEIFAIDLGLGFKTKRDKMAWLSFLNEPKGKNGLSLTRSEVNRLESINSHLSKFMMEDEL